MYKRYIGITGFTSAQQIEELLRTCPMDPDIDPLLMVGVLASSKTLRGEKTKYALRYPDIRDIQTIFTDNPNCLNLIHYHPANFDTITDQMMEIIMMGGKYCHGLQLNACWIPPSDLVSFRIFDSTSTLVLQIGERAQEIFENDPKKIAAKVSDYLGLVQYALIDPSGGKGKPMDLKKTEILLDEFFDHGLNDYITFGIAGGISAEIIPQLAPLVKKYGVSIDAEGQLRNEQDEFQMDKAMTYLQESLRYLT